MSAAFYTETAVITPRRPYRGGGGQGHLAALVLAGEGEAKSGGHTEDFEEGCVLVFRSLQEPVLAARYNTNCSVLLFYVQPGSLHSLLADGQALRLVASLLNGEGQLIKAQIAADAFQSLVRCHGIIHRELQNQKPCHLRIAGSLAAAFLLTLARECGFITAGGQAATVLGPVEKAKQSIYARFAEPLSLSAMAAEFGLSAPYFSALFKREAGLSFSEFVGRVRMEKAKAMLLDSQDLITHIAEASGFGSSAHFGYVFKKSTGFSPLQFRALYRKDQKGYFSSTV